MTTQDIEIALLFLRRVVARGPEEDALLGLVERMENELRRRRQQDRG